MKMTRIWMALAFAALAGLLATPSRAASFPASAAMTLENASRNSIEPVQYRRRAYRPARVYRPARSYRPVRVYRRPVYRSRVVRYGYPVYGRPAYVGRRCVNQARWVWTPYGQVRRYVRVCR